MGVVKRGHERREGLGGEEGECEVGERAWGQGWRVWG